MNVDDVATELVSRLAVVDDALQTYKGPPDSVTVPAAVVVLPEEIAYDETFGRGSDSMTWPVMILIGRVGDDSVMERIGAYCDGSGTSSVKATLEDRAYTYTTCDVVHVKNCKIDVVTWQGTDYIGAIFELMIFGQGAP